MYYCLTYNSENSTTVGLYGTHPLKMMYPYGYGNIRYSSTCTYRCTHTVTILSTDLYTYLQIYMYIYICLAIYMCWYSYKRHLTEPKRRAEEEDCTEKSSLLSLFILSINYTTSYLWMKTNTSLYCCKHVLCRFTSEQHFILCPHDVNRLHVKQREEATTGSAAQSIFSGYISRLLGLGSDSSHKLSPDHSRPSTGVDV